MTVNIGAFIGILIVVFVFGMTLGSLSMLIYGWKWLNADPDGEGGYESRMEALSQRYSKHNGKGNGNG